MPYIKVDINKIKSYQQDITSVRNKVNKISEEFSTIGYQLDSDIKVRSSIGSRINTVESSLANHEIVLQRMDSFLGRTTSSYAAADRTQQSSDYTEAQKKFIVETAAVELGVDTSFIQETLNDGASMDDIFEWLSGTADRTNKFVENVNKGLRFITGAKDLAFNMKDGYVIVSKFTRDSFLNNLVKWAHDGVGVGTRYTVDGLKNTPIIGTIYKAGEIADKVGKVCDVIQGIASVGSGIVDATQKIDKIWDNDDLSDKEKIINTSAVVITSAVGTAMEVAAPIAGEAVKGIVQGAITAALPGAGVVVGAAVGFIAGAVVEKGVELVADVIRSEAVINQVADSIEKVGDAVASGVKAVSDAGKKLVESKSVGDAIVNTAALVGTAVVSGVKVAATVAVEAVKTKVTVAVETVKTGVKKAATAVKNFFKKW